MNGNDTPLQRARAAMRRIVLSLAAFSLVINLLMLTMPLYMLQIYDRVLPSRSIDTLIFLSIFAVAALVVLGILEAVRGIIASRAAARLETELGEAAIRVGLESSRPESSDIRPVRDLAAIRQFVSSRALFALLDMPFAPIFIGILYFIHPTLFWLTVAGAVVLLLIAMLTQRLTAAQTTASREHGQAATGFAQALSANGETVRAMGMSENGLAVWGSRQADTLAAQAALDARTAILGGIARTVRMGLQIAILGVGGWLVLQDQMTAGMIFAASIISGRGLQPIDQVIGGWKQTMAVREAWVSLRDTLAGRFAPQQRTLLPPATGLVEVDGVTVLSPRGPAAPPILHNVTFTVKPGELIGVVGPSGSGKSTLARVLVGAQGDHPGTVRIDGTELQNWDASQLGAQIGYLGQHVDLLPGTIGQNIARLSAERDDAAVLDAARKAQVHELIVNLPKTYDTMVGPGGSGLSGGQRQRIGLARAFYGAPRILVLDEPNANLDETGEAALHRALEGAKAAGITVIVVTQRKEVLAMVDKILRLREGRQDFFGTRDEFIHALKKMRAAKAGAGAANAPQGADKPRGVSAPYVVGNPGRQTVRTVKAASNGPTAPMVKSLGQGGTDR